MRTTSDSLGSLSANWLSDSCMDHCFPDHWSIALPFSPCVCEKEFQQCSWEAQSMDGLMSYSHPCLQTKRWAIKEIPHMSSWTEPTDTGSQVASEITFFIMVGYLPPWNWFSGSVFTFTRANFKPKTAYHPFMTNTYLNIWSIFVTLVHSWPWPCPSSKLCQLLLQRTINNKNK